MLIMKVNMLRWCLSSADVSLSVGMTSLSLENLQHLFFELVLLQLLLVCFLLFLFYVCLLFLRCLTRILARYQLPELRAPFPDGTRPFVVGFFHPYCNAGGGGERVLWCAIRALQSRYKEVRCVVYTGDVDSTQEEIVRRARERFNVVLPRTGPQDLVFIQLFNRILVEASTYPRLTLLGQSLGSVLLGFEAMFRFIPDVYIDSMGYAFTFPLFKYLAGSRVACYVHYPTVSSDMLQRVADGVNAHNNPAYVSRSVVLSTVKLWYYKAYAKIYGFVGRFSEVTVVNSTWTQGHIVNIWKVPATIVYPPCNVAEFLTIPINDREGPTKYIVSLAQFRPEKNHQLQLQSFKKFLSSSETGEASGGSAGPTRGFKLLLVGSCRNEEDAARVEQLKRSAESLGLEGRVEFRLDVPFDDLKAVVASASVGLHTMWNEHFGIGIVELMAAGVVVLAHDSGGPKADIVVDFEGGRTGFLASDEDSYAEKLAEIFSLPDERLREIKLNARRSVQRFSDSQFESNFLNAVRPLFDYI